MPVHADQSIPMRKRGRPPNPEPMLTAPVEPAHSFGLRVRHLRRQAGWSRYMLAKVMQTQPSVIRKWERCVYSPSLPLLRRLRVVFGCDWSELLGE
jgi:ribosome-binding protein aMBF1 (putative translation factor)